MEETQPDKGNRPKLTPEMENVLIPLGRLLDRSFVTMNGHHNDLAISVNVALLPQADELNRSETAWPDATTYIMKAADEERVHRHTQKRLVTEGTERRRSVSLERTFVLSALGLVASAVGAFWEIHGLQPLSP